MSAVLGFTDIYHNFCSLSDLHEMSTVDGDVGVKLVLTN